MKALLDTNVLIGFFLNPNQKEEFEARTLRPQIFMSSVVAMELFAGCRTNLQQRELASLLKPFERAGRMLTPTHACFSEAGRVLAGLGADGVQAVERRSLVNDVLIAVTAARNGVVVVTANVKDFSRIERHTPVRWMLPV